MNLGEIRAQFISRSGRRDLTESNNTDRGADFFIEAGLRLLDSFVDHPESNAPHIENISAGAYTLKLQYCRSIQNVWIANADGRGELDRLSLNNIRTAFSDKPVGEISRGAPAYYAPSLIKLAPAQQALEESDFSSSWDFDTIVFGDSNSVGYTGVYFLPPADKVYTMSVYGKWFTIFPTADGDDAICYWSVVYPEVLIQSCLRALEGFYRNTTGIKDWEATMAPVLDAVDKDMVEMESGHITQIGG